MEREAILKKLEQAIVDFDTATVQEACREALEKDIAAYDIVTQGMAKGMEIVGQKYESGDFFISELIMAGETMKEGMRIVRPHLRSEEAVPRGMVVIGTVQGDLHDLGKNIVATLLRASGFQVIDLGFDVAPQRFVEETRNSKPNIVGMSALLTTTMVNIDTTIGELGKAKLRQQVKVIVGGAAISSEYARKAGADASANDAVKGVAICKKWTKATKIERHRNLEPEQLAYRPDRPRRSPSAPKRSRKFKSYRGAKTSKFLTENEPDFVPCAYRWSGDACPLRSALIDYRGLESYPH